MPGFIITVYFSPIFDSIMITELNRRQIAACCIFPLLIGCAGTPEERQQMKIEGQALFSQHSEDCYDLAWSKHPADFQTVPATRSRNRQIQTGMICIKDKTVEHRENCSNTYRTETEYYTTEETRDLNQQYRDSFYGFCLTNKCNDAIGAPSKDEGFMTLQGQKYSYCRQG